MKNVVCNKCANTFPMNDTLKVNGDIYCGECFKSQFQNKDSSNGQTTEKDYDPTVCFICKKDFGSWELKKLSHYHVCDECLITIKNRTFPNWVKAFLVFSLLIVVFAFAFNWKYYRAYKDITNLGQTMQKGDFAGAFALMQDAASIVPEVEDIKTLSRYYHGLDLLSKDKGDEALTEFEYCSPRLTSDYAVDKLILQARISSSYQKKDYNGFLLAAREQLSLDTTQVLSWASVASAYSCLYAINGADSSKSLSVKYMKKAQTLDSISEEMKQYYNLIDYRLDTRDLIDREDFTKKYPNGWSKK